MISGCAPGMGQAGRPPGGASGFRLVLGQPEQTKGEALAATQDEALKAGLAGDLDGTFEELVTAYQDRLYSFALRLTGRREDAEEVAQDAFVRAYRALGGYPAERVRAMALRAWLYQITLNVARNRFRGKKLKLVSLDHPLPGGGDATFEAADDEALRPDARYEQSRQRADIASLVAGAARAVPRAADPALRRGAAPGRGGPGAQAAGGDREIERASWSQCPARSPYGVASRKEGVRT